MRDRVGDLPGAYVTRGLGREGREEDENGRGRGEVRGRNGRRRGERKGRGGQ